MRRDVGIAPYGRKTSVGGIMRAAEGGGPYSSK